MTSTTIPPRKKNKVDEGFLGDDCKFSEGEGDIAALQTM